MKTAITSNVKYLAKLSGIFVVNLIKSHLLGLTSTVLVLIIGVFVIAAQVDTGSTEHASVISFLVVPAMVKPFTVIPFYIIILVSPFLLFSFAGKYATSKVINKLVKDKSDSFISPMVEKILQGIKERQPDIFRKGVDQGKMKLKIIQEVKNNSDSKIVVKVVNYALNKVNVADVDFGDENMSLVQVIRDKIMEKLHEMSEPSLGFLWIIVGLQWLILALMHFTGY